MTTQTESTIIDLRLDEIGPDEPGSIIMPPGIPLPDALVGSYLIG